jgi:hypothetical protein
MSEDSKSGEKPDQPEVINDKTAPSQDPQRPRSTKMVSKKPKVKMKSDKPLPSRSIRNITRDSANKKNNGKPAFSDDNKFSSRRYKQTGSKSLVIILGVIGLLIASFLILSIVMHRASLELITNPVLLSTNDELEFDSSEFELRSVRVTESTVVSAAGIEEVEDSAEGIITVFNTTDEPQRLIATTRFEAPNGVEYITPVAITIPAADGPNNPGELKNVMVVSNISGEGSNQTVNQDLSVPGLVGTELEDLIYATAQTPFTGGFVGQRPVADETDLENASDQLQQNLEESFESLARTQLNEGSLLIGVNSDISFDVDQQQVSGNDSQVQVESTASAEVIVINEEIFLRKLAAVAQKPVDVSDNLRIENPESIVFNIESIDENGIELEVDSNVRSEYVIDPQSIKEAIAGMSADEIDEVLSNDSAIARYNLDISPLWKNSIPENTEKITVLINTGNVEDIERLPVIEDDEPLNDSEIIDEIDTDSDDSEINEEDEITTIRTNL